MSHVSKLHNLLNRFSVKKTLRIIFFSCFLGPVVVISSFFVFHFYKSLSNWELEKVKTSMEYTMQSFDSVINQMKSFSDRIYVNKQLQNIILSDYSDVQEVYSAYNDLRFLEDYLRSYDEISSFRIYTENYQLLDNQFIIKANPSIKSKHWYERAKLEKGQTLWVYEQDVITKKYYFSVVRSIWGAVSGEFVGVLVINLNNDYIEKNLTNQIYDTYIFYNNQKLYNSNKYVKIDDDSILQKAIEKYKNSSELVKIKLKFQSAGLYISDFYPSNNIPIKFKIIYLVPYNNLSQASNVLLIYLIVLIAVIIFLSVIVIFIFSRHLGNRVEKVQKGISSVVKNNFEIPQSIGGNDEFESIYKDLYDMSCHIKNLIDTVYKQNLEKEQLSAKQNEISFKMLSSQINPHFLFNSLETIRMKSLSSGDKEVSTMLRILASLLRYNLSVKGEPVSLIKEVEAVQNYLNIQHMRFKDRISFDIIPLCNIQEISILPLLIQPIVENSFNHGLEDMVQGGTIYIFIDTEKVDDIELLKISVKDNGCGIPNQKLIEINKRLENEGSQVYTSSIGLVNVNSRIKVFYGKQYGINIQSEEGHGTIVTITIPLIRNTVSGGF